MTAVRSLLVLCVVVVAAAAARDAAVALSVLDLGRVPGGDAPLPGLVGAGVLALVSAGFVGGLGVLRDPRDRLVHMLLASLDLLAGAFVVARFYAFDPYFLPTLRRYSEGGNVRGAWIALVVAVALAAAVLTALRPRQGAALSLAVLVVAGATALLASIGH